VEKAVKNAGKGATPHVFGKSAQTIEKKEVRLVFTATVCAKSAQAVENAGVEKRVVWSKCESVRGGKRARS
jgi:hypothetical protein